jgi:antitoxin ParD1/3/4
MNVKTRNVSLTPEIDAFIGGQITSGRYNSASEVVRAALRLLEEQERRRGTFVHEQIADRQPSAR